MSDARITYTFVAAGHGAVVNAFQSIEKAAEQSAKATERSEVRRDKAARTSAVSATRAAERVEREAEKAAQRKVTAAEKAAQQEAKAAEKAATQEAKAKERALAHVAKIRDRYFLDQQRQEEKAQRDNQRRHERSIALMQRAEERIESARRQRVAHTKERVRDVAVGTLATGAAIGSGLFMAGARDIFRLNSAATRLSINARNAGEDAVDPSQLRREFEGIAKASPGVSSADIAEGVTGFVGKTGDLAAGRRFASTFATVASATGSQFGDIANAAADLMQKFDIKTIEDMQSALAALTFQGKSGAFELKDAAAQFAKLSSAAQRFGLDKGAKGVATLGGLTQIARSATGSPEQAATAVEAMFRQLVVSSKKLRAQGVHVFSDRAGTKTRDIQDVLVDTISKLHGSLPKLQAVFGEEGIRGISPLVATFNEAHNSATGTEAQKTAAGVHALREALEKAIDAPGDWAEVVKDAAAAAKDPANQMSASWEQFKSAIDPVVSEALPLLASAIVSTAGFVEKTLGVVFPGAKHEATHTEQLTEAQKTLAAFDKQNGDPSKLTGFLKTKREFLAESVAREQTAADREQTPEGRKIMAARAAREQERSSIGGRLAGFVDRFTGHNLANDENQMRVAEDRTMAAVLAIQHIKDRPAPGSLESFKMDPEARKKSEAHTVSAVNAMSGVDATATNAALKQLQDAATTTAAALKDIKAQQQQGNAFVGG